MHVNTTPHPNLPPQGGKESSFQSQLASLITANEATNLMKAVAPQTPGVAQRLSNALADIAGKAVTTSGARKCWLEHLSLVLDAAYTNYPAEAVINGKSFNHGLSGWGFGTRLQVRM